MNIFKIVSLNMVKVVKIYLYLTPFFFLMFEFELTNKFNLIN